MFNTRPVPEVRAQHLNVFLSFDHSKPFISLSYARNVLGYLRVQTSLKGEKIFCFKKAFVVVLDMVDKTVEMWKEPGFVGVPQVKQ